MKDAPFHYDGSVPVTEESGQLEELIISKDISRHLSGNPYLLPENE